MLVQYVASASELAEYPNSITPAVSCDLGVLMSVRSWRTLRLISACVSFYRSRRTRSQVSTLTGQRVLVKKRFATVFFTSLQFYFYKANKIKSQIGGEL